MIIRCPSCGSTYDISKQPQAAGRKVKCMRCSHVWKAEPVDAAPPAPPQRPMGETVAAGMAPPPPSEIAVPRPVVAAPRPSDTAVVHAEGPGTANPAFGEEPPGVGKNHNGFSGLNGDHRGNGFADTSAYDPPAPPATAAGRRTGEFDEAPQRNRRPAAPRQEADYFDDGSPPQRAARRPEPQWREPPRETYRDDVYGNYDRGYGQDEFTPARDDRARRDQPSRGRRAAAIVGWVAYLAALGALGAYAYAGRDQIVAWLPGAAPYYANFGLPVNRYGLEFRDVKAAWGKVVAGQAEVVVSVGVQNVTDRAVKVPTVVFAFKDANGDEIFYRAMTDALPGTLQAGKTAKFSATLQVPAAATRAIQVRFATSL